MSDELRRRAEQPLAEDGAGTPVDMADLQRLVHELRVHQIELELQNEELRLMRDAAEAANRAKAEFLANISHEIRSPLNAIRGFGHALRRTASPEQAARIDRIEQASQNLLVILDDVLDLAKIEAGRLQLDDKAFDPREILESVRGMVAQAATSKGLRLEVETAAGLPPRLVGDPARLRQALLNLAGNAVKFTEHGGIILRGLLEREDMETAWLRFEVRDTGIGIDAATQARLFRPFEQGDASATRRYGGTGLGLDLVRRLAGLMGGGVGADSAPGAGSLFWFTARLNKAGRGGAETRATRATAKAVDAPQVLKHEFGGWHILLADDDTMSRYGSVLMLREMGLEVAVANDGEHAIASFTTAPPDLVLLGLRMAGMDGLVAARRIRTLPAGRSMPIVAFSANAIEEDRATSLAAGIDDLVAKPFVAGALADVLLRQLRRYNGRSSGRSGE